MHWVLMNPIQVYCLLRGQYRTCYRYYLNRFTDRVLFLIFNNILYIYTVHSSFWFCVFVVILCHQKYSTYVLMFCQWLEVSIVILESIWFGFMIYVLAITL